MIGMPSLLGSDLEAICPHAAGDEALLLKAKGKQVMSKLSSLEAQAKIADKPKHISGAAIVAVRPKITL